MSDEQGRTRRNDFVVSSDVFDIGRYQLEFCKGPLSVCPTSGDANGARGWTNSRVMRVALRVLYYALQGVDNPLACGLGVDDCFSDVELVELMIKAQNRRAHNGG